MQNIIFTTYDKNNNQEYISIGSAWYMQEQIRRTGRQLVNVLGIEQTEEEWEYCKQMTVEQLYRWLTSFQNENFIKTMYLN